MGIESVFTALREEFRDDAVILEIISKMERELSSIEQLLVAGQYSSALVESAKFAQNIAKILYRRMGCEVYVGKDVRLNDLLELCKGSGDLPEHVRATVPHLLLFLQALRSKTDAAHVKLKDPSRFDATLAYIVSLWAISAISPRYQEISVPTSIGITYPLVDEKDGIWLLLTDELTVQDSILVYLLHRSDTWLSAKEIADALPGVSYVAVRNALYRLRDAAYVFQKRGEDGPLYSISKKGISRALQAIQDYYTG